MSSSSQIIEEFTEIILQYLFDSIGQKNIIAIILSGSISRGQASFKKVDEKLFLESDFDIIVVVKRSVIFKSLILIKKLAENLTSKLKKRGLLSHVSFAVTTENSLRRLKPSIFYQDLRNYGKVIYGKDIISTLQNFETKQIPDHDVYRLIFNRMIETLEVLASSKLNEKKLTKDYYDLILSFFGKLTFALIQSVLIKEGILIFRGYNLDELKVEGRQFINKKLLNELIDTYRELRSDQVRENFSIDIIKKQLFIVIRQFRTTLEKITNLNDSSAESCEKLFRRNEGLAQRIKFSLIVLLAYITFTNRIDLLRTVVFIINYGVDYVYNPLYRLFLSSDTLLDPAITKEINEKYDETDSPISQSYDNAKKIWLKSFHKYYKIWKMKAGMQ